MKKRNGFVSNSSSSSFVIIGYKIKSLEDIFKKLNPSKYEEIVKEAEEDAWEINDILYDYVHDNGLVDGLKFLTDGYGDSDYIGHIVSEEKDYQLSNNELSGQEIIKIMEDVKNKAGMEEMPSLIAGSRGC